MSDIREEYKYSFTSPKTLLDEVKPIVSFSPNLDIILGGGIPMGSFVIVTGQKKLGKMQDVDSLIYTPTGPKRLGDIQLLDVVCTPDSKAATVQEIYRHGLQNVYEVEFTDGSVCRCGLDHLWYASQNGDDYQVVSLSDIIFSDNITDWTIPLTSPVYFNEQSVEIAPFQFGTSLRRARHIPEQYLYNSIENRWSLLEGLTGLSRSALIQETVEYDTTCQQIAIDIIKLIQSLGGIAEYTQESTTISGRLFELYKLRMSFLDTKKSIVKITPLGPKECLCIKIDNENGLYLTDNFIVTHNTTSVLHFAANAQKAGHKIYYFDVEGRLKSRDLGGIPGLKLDTDNLEIIKSNKKKLLTGDDYLTILMSLIETEENAVFIVDSISQLCSAARHAGSISERFRDDIPLMLAALTKRCANILPVNHNTLICITHLIANQGNGPATWMEASGQKVQYQADVKLKVTHIEAHMDGDKQVGQLLHWQCDTNALGPPGGKTTTLLRYGEGLDEYYDVLAMALDVGILTKKGAWIKFKDDSQVQGKEKARNFLKDNPDLYKSVLADIKEIIA